MTAHTRGFWLAKRLISGVVVVWAAATFSFVVQLMMPGERAQIIFSSESGTVGTAPPAALAAINAKYGFDQPFAVQYGRYIWGLLQGDLGRSYFQHQPVVKLIAEQIAPTLILAIAALVTAWILTVLTTVLLAGRDNLWSKLLSGAQALLATLPPYWLATILLVVFAVKLNIFPVVGGNSALGLVLPTLALAFELYGVLGQVVLAEFNRALNQPFVASARTRGMGDLGVRFRHVLRHAVLPGVTLSGWIVGKLLSGAVLIEAVFARQGLGGVLIAASSSRDVPVVSGVILVSAALFVITTMIVDVIYQLVDPRIKLA